MPSSFRSALDKIQQAQIHIESLWNAIHGFENMNAYGLVGQDDADGWHSVRLRINMPPPIELPMIAGDAIHSARSALDHAIYEVSRAPAKKRRRVSFPLYSKRVDYLEGKRSGWWKRALAGVPTEYRAIVEREQPFRRRNHRLGPLAEFDNIDKHRTVHTSIARAGRVPVAAVTPGFTLEFRYSPVGKRLKNGAEVFAYRVLATPIGIKKVEVKVDYLLTVGFGPRNLTKSDLSDLVNRASLVILDMQNVGRRHPIRLLSKEVEGGTALYTPGRGRRPHLLNPLWRRVNRPPN